VIEEALKAGVDVSDEALQEIVGGKIAQSDIPDSLLALLTALRGGIWPWP
jgi:hypothetical protein